MEEKNYFSFTEQLKTFWPVVLVVVSLAAQWAILGQRVKSVEEHQDRQDITVAALQVSVSAVQTQYASLSAKLDAIDQNVNYIRTRIDAEKR